jgi:hypothetical protein
MRLTLALALLLAVPRHAPSAPRTPLERAEEVYVVTRGYRGAVGVLGVLRSPAALDEVATHNGWEHLDGPGAGCVRLWRRPCGDVGGWVTYEYLRVHQFRIEE